MSTIASLALTVAAHNHLALEGSEAEALNLFHALKQRAEADPQMMIGQLKPCDIRDQYDGMTVLELVEMIEHEAAQLVSFSSRVVEAAHQGMKDAAEEHGFELEASQWNLVAFAEVRLATEHAQELITKLSVLHPEKKWGVFPIGDYSQFADADAPDVLVTFGCDEQDLDGGLPDPFSSMLGDSCDPSAWGLSVEAAKLIRKFNKVDIAKYPNCDGPKQRA